VTSVDGAWRGEKLLNLKQIADGAVAICDEKFVSVSFHSVYKVDNIQLYRTIYCG